jgi:hypothetical protein
MLQIGCGGEEDQIEEYSRERDAELPPSYWNS